MGIYLDNACTTYPKPACVAQAVADFIQNAGTNINRGSYEGAFDVEDRVFECRERLNTLFGGTDPAHVVFTRCVTESLNLVLKGALAPGDHVVVSSMEHNAVMRPLNQLAARGVSFTRVACAPDGTLDPADVERALTPATRLVVMTHASNVCGTVLPLAEVGAICAAHGIDFVVDAAQTAGVLPVRMDELHAQAICFTGHKGLMGPQGTGGAVLSPAFAERLEPLVAGGTGSASDSELTPSFMPDKFEAGTLNLPGIVGLLAALRWLDEQKPGAIAAHELALTGRFLEGLAPLEEAGLLQVAGRHDLAGRVGVVSVSTPGHDLADLAHRLDRDFGIQTRVGLHCAPSAHKTLGTFPTGTLRFSFGYANTADDVDAAVDALGGLLSAHAEKPVQPAPPARPAPPTQDPHTHR